MIYINNIYIYIYIYLNIVILIDILYLSDMIYRMAADLKARADQLGRFFTVSTLTNLSVGMLTMFKNDLANMDRFTHNECAYTWLSNIIYIYIYIIYTGLYIYIYILTISIYIYIYIYIYTYI